MMYDIINIVAGFHPCPCRRNKGDNEKMKNARSLERVEREREREP